jgi:hypothetical protein
VRPASQLGQARRWGSCSADSHTRRLLPSQAALAFKARVLLRGRRRTDALLGRGTGSPPASARPSNPDAAKSEPELRRELQQLREVFAAEQQELARVSCQCLPARCWEWHCTLPAVHALDLV